MFLTLEDLGWDLKAKIRDALKFFGGEALLLSVEYSVQWVSTPMVWYIYIVCVYKYIYMYIHRL